VLRGFLQAIVNPVQRDIAHPLALGRVHAIKRDVAFGLALEPPEHKQGDGNSGEADDDADNRSLVHRQAA
jgi:hypothetical protein